MKYKHKYGQKLTQSRFTLILKLKVTQKNFFGKPIYDFLCVGNVHKRSILKDKKDIERWKLHNLPLFLKSCPFLSLGQKDPILFKHGLSKRYDISLVKNFKQFAWQFFRYNSKQLKIAPSAPRKRILFFNRKKWENVWNPKFSLC